MKTILSKLSKAAVFAAVIALMMQCAPLLGGMMTSMFGQYEVLAQSIVTQDANGNVEFNGQGAEATLITLGNKSQEFTNTIGEQAQEVLNTAKIESEVSEDDKADFEELKTKAKELLNEINKFFKLNF